VLVLGGVISGSLFTSLLSVLKHADPNDALPAITYFFDGQPRLCVQELHRDFNPADVREHFRC